jgi:hypothetical protein
MPDHITDHERDRAIGQWDGIEPVTSSRLLLPGGQVTRRDPRPGQHRQCGGQQRLLQHSHSAGGIEAALIRASRLLPRPRWPLLLVSHVGTCSRPPERHRSGHLPDRRTVVVSSIRHRQPSPPGA